MRAAVAQLFRGPRAAERADDVDTQIPKGVRLREFTIDSARTATVRLSPGFLKGIPAAPAARTAEQTAVLKARLGQITYTVTQFKHIKRATVYAGDLVLPDLDRGDYRRPTTGPTPTVVTPGPAVAGIRETQTALARLGYLPQEAVDGLAGDRTRQAVLAFQSWEGLGRDGVVGPATTARLATAKRPAPRGSGRRIEVYRDRGVALLVSGGETVRAIHVSTGAPGFTTPPGSYKVFRKELRSWSVPFSTWLPYASYFNNGIAFHEYPEVPAYPASHGCVRVPASEAPRVYEFATVGTVVDVY